MISICDNCIIDRVARKKQLHPMMDVNRSINMKITIPKQTSFDVPEGQYRVKLRDVCELSRKRMDCDSQVRLVFDVVFPNDKRKQFKLGKNYCADCDHSSELIADLEAWLGDDLANLQDDGGKLDLAKLKGREADVDVSHISNEKYEQPFVYIKGMYEPGTLLPASLS